MSKWLLICVLLVCLLCGCTTKRYDPDRPDEYHRFWKDCDNVEDSAAVEVFGAETNCPE